MFNAMLDAIKEESVGSSSTSRSSSPPRRSRRWTPRRCPPGGSGRPAVRAGADRERPARRRPLGQPAVFGADARQHRAGEGRDRRCSRQQWRAPPQHALPLRLGQEVQAPATAHRPQLADRCHRRPGPRWPGRRCLPLTAPRGRPRASGRRSPPAGRPPPNRPCRAKRPRRSGHAVGGLAHPYGLDQRHHPWCGLPPHVVGHPGDLRADGLARPLLQLGRRTRTGQGLEHRLQESRSPHFRNRQIRRAVGCGSKKSISCSNRRGAGSSNGSSSRCRITPSGPSGSSSSYGGSSRGTRRTVGRRDRPAPPDEGSSAGTDTGRSFLRERTLASKEDTGRNGQKGVFIPR